MKKLILKSIFLSFAAFLIGCQEDDKVFNADGNETAYFFSSSIVSFPVSQDSNSVDVSVGVTTRSSSSRTYSVAVNAEKTTATPDMYSIDNASLVIDANSFNGVMSITSNLDVLPEGETFALVLDLVATNGYPMPSKDQVTISIFKSCPVPATSFVGSYLIAELTPYVDGPTLDDGSVVTVTAIAGSDLGRTFMTKNYPNYCTPLRAFNFDLVCGDVIVRAEQPSTCACTAAGLFFGPATEPSTFDVNDDSYFELTFTNDVTGDCSAAVQTTYSFTKQ
uniref:hypothetical protein n=1 Tax=Flavobacterium sp. TaxID=239 RepID=UPI00404A89F5